MNLELNDIQSQLRDALSRLLANEYTFEARGQHVQDPRGYSADFWAQLAEMGVLGAAIGEEQGGFGGDAVDTMLVSEALGAVLATEPYHATVVMAANALQAAGSLAQQAKWLPLIAQGQAQLGWAHQEPGDAARVATRARLEAGQWRLSGSKVLVLNGPHCEQWVVSAVDDDGALALFMVDAQAAHTTVDAYRLVDGSPAADIHFDGAPAERLGGAQGPALATAMERIQAIGIMAACAEMVGGMEAVIGLTLAYLKTRHQFGRAIGSYQALQHRAVEMRIALEQSRSLVMSMALSLAGRNDLEGGSLQFHAAKVLVGRQARRVAQEAIQMHGGIGMTEECAVGHYLQRVLVLDQLHGDVQQHLSALEQR